MSIIKTYTAKTRNPLNHLRRLPILMYIRDRNYKVHRFCGVGAGEKRLRAVVTYAILCHFPNTYTSYTFTNGTNCFRRSIYKDTWLLILSVLLSHESSSNKKARVNGWGVWKKRLIEIEIRRLIAKYIKTRIIVNTYLWEPMTYAFQIFYYLIRHHIPFPKAK